MDDVWAAFNETTGTSYVARNENAITLCSSGATAAEALHAMAGLIGTYDDPVVLATNFYSHDDYYYMSVIISGWL